MRAASSSAHSGASVRPREPMAVQAHKPGNVAASTGPTTGNRSGAVHRTAAQVRAWGGCVAAAQACDSAGSRLFSFAQLDNSAASRSPAEGGNASTSRSKVDPSTHASKAGASASASKDASQGNPGTRLPLPFTGKGGSDTVPGGCNPQDTWPRTGCNAQRCGSSCKLPAPAAITIVDASARI